MILMETNEGEISSKLDAIENQINYLSHGQNSSGVKHQIQIQRLKDERSALKKDLLKIMGRAPKRNWMDSATEVQKLLISDAGFSEKMVKGLNKKQIEAQWHLRGLDKKYPDVKL